MKTRRLTAAAATAAAGALILSACSTPSPENTDAGINQDTAVTVGWNQTYYEYNTNSATGNATANAIVDYLMNDQVVYYDADLNLVNDTGFVTMEKVSDDPLKVKYTVNDNATWSDGVPVTAADLLLTWGSQSGHFNTQEFGTDEDGNPIYPEGSDKAGEKVPEKVLNNTVFFNATIDTIGLIEEFPEISDDGKTITFTYSKPFADWKVNLGVGVPAHVVASHALDIDDPAKATQALIEAFKNDDAEKLSPISEFWNTGFRFGDTLPDDESLYLSSGPYLLTDFKRDQYVTLEANPDYQGSRTPKIQTITIRYNGDPMAQVQALQNGELDLISPQASSDTLEALKNLGDGYEVITKEGAVYEHVDLVMDNDGPFDPSSYGGDEDTARMVRKAFLKLIPRQDIVERIIQPLNPDAKVRNSYTQVPGSPGYETVTEMNGMAETYPADVDREGAKQLLEKAGVDTPIKVRFLTDSKNTRRQDELTLIRKSVEKDDLFKIVDKSNAEWGSMLADGSKYDASLFGWQSTSTAVTESCPNFTTGSINNFGGFSSDKVDQLCEQLYTETDEQKQIEILGQIEKILADQGFSVTLYQFPQVTGFTTDLKGVDPIAISPTIFWNFWQWSTTESGGGGDSTEG